MIGDRVLSVNSSGAVGPSSVYVMPHAVQSGVFHFKRLVMASNHSLTLTPDHYMLISDPAHPGQWEQHRAVTAGQVRPGDKVWIVDDESHELKETQIVDVVDAFEEGIFAPLTLTGSIIVDKVVASVYSSMLGSESTMHAFCAWGRYLWGRIPQLFIGLHSLGWASPMAMGIGNAARAVLRMVSIVLPQASFA